MGERRSTGGLITLAVLAIGVCCGLPLLLSAGLLGAAVGIGLGNWLVIAIGVVVATTGAVAWLQRRSRTDGHEPADKGLPEEVRDERTV